MEIVLAALVAAAVAVAVALLVHRPRAVQAGASAVAAPEPSAGAEPRTAARRDALEEELLARRAEIARLEERLHGRESTLDMKAQQLTERERSLDDRQRNLDHVREELKEVKSRQIRELERVAGLSAGQAKQILMRDLEDELRHESARIIRQVEEETRHDADRRARSILAAVMQRVAASHAVETTVSTPSKAASKEARSRKSPCTGCAPASISSSADVARPCCTSCEEGESRRTRTRTSLPCSNNPRVIMPPTTPVAPTTRIIFFLLLALLCLAGAPFAR